MESDKKIRLKKLVVYPVKSCSGFEVPSWKVGEKGLDYDRTWMIVDSTGREVDLHRVHQLYWVETSIDFQNDLLRLTYEDMPPITVPLTLDKTQPQKQASIYGFKFTCYDCGDEVAEWLEEITYITGCRLIRQADQIREGILDVKVENEKLSLVDTSQYLLVAEASLDWLATKLNEKYELTVDEEDFWTLENLTYRFRANMIIEGTEKEFQEDNWNSIELCGVDFRVQDQCIRCQKTCVDRKTAQKDREPLKTITELRGKKMPFGIHLAHTGSMIGAKITIDTAINVLNA